jgi:hypothetical protein
MRMLALLVACGGGKKVEATDGQAVLPGASKGLAAAAGSVPLAIAALSWSNTQILIESVRDEHHWFLMFQGNLSHQNPMSVSALKGG